MFQRLASLFFGEGEEVTNGCEGPKPSMADADEEGWLLINLPGSTPETSSMEDLLIEHPSMSVYVATGNQSITEETGSYPLQEINQKVETANPGGRGLSGRPARGSAVQATVLGKICQVNRVQRAERRQLSRNRVKRQNRLRENLPWSGGRAKGSFVHQPRQRQCNY
ncbi:tumor protein p53-inducible nuclear protein 2-like isoform X3 [Polyodon spathula]|uniref:tumor protein p53-inducible nuclear protein 2-like isoform X3 n=1 Tax=Polyodon spathula TaxID=7913 RepID=UPI001B7E49D7|nr:tumor protein p53-inducible nuclear protein 2-like isoform X3 [Polyodon spathula]